MVIITKDTSYVVKQITMDGIYAIRLKLVDNSEITIDRCEIVKILPN